MNKTKERIFAKSTKSFLIVLGFLCAIGLSACFKPSPLLKETATTAELTLPLSHTLSEEEAKEDLKYLMELLQSRKVIWGDTYRLAEAQYFTEQNAIRGPCTVLDLYKATARVTAKLRDVHTATSWQGSEFFHIDDFTHLKEYGMPLTVNGIDTQQILAAFKKVFSFETDYYAENYFYQNALCSKQYLDLCGVDTKNGVTMTFDCGGKTTEFRYRFIPSKREENLIHRENNAFASYTIDKENNLGVFTLPSCLYNDFFKDVLAEFFTTVIDNGITNVALDVRDNFGGNIRIVYEIMTYLPIKHYIPCDSYCYVDGISRTRENLMFINETKPKPYTGNLFVVTNVNTCSSAMQLAQYVSYNKRGVIVGEPSGNLPDFCGNVSYYYLPNSHLKFSIASERYYRIDKKKRNQPLMPDYIVESKNALNKVYELARNQF